MLLRGKEPVGVWPFHRLRGSLGLPIGGALNDYHGPLVAPGFTFTPLQFLQVARLTRFEFHSHYPEQPGFHPFGFHRQLARSWVDLAGGAEAYLKQLHARSQRIGRQPQKTRKLARELGAPRFVADSNDPADLQWLIEAKREKYRRTGCSDYFAPDWSRQLLWNLQQTRTDRFRGVCSILWAGDERVAGHFGLLANGILHYWLPVLSLSAARYSPGTELFLRLAQSAAELGFEKVDFGYGNEPFKQTLATDWGSVLVGSVDANPARWQWHRWLERTRLRIKASRFRGLVRRLARALVPDLGKAKIR